MFDLVACLDFVLMMVLNYTASLFVGKSMPFGYFMPFSRGVLSDDVGVCN